MLYFRQLTHASLVNTQSVSQAGLLLLAAVALNWDTDSEPHDNARRLTSQILITNQ